MNTPIKERYWQIESEDRDPDYPGWHHEVDDIFLSVGQALQEARKLSEKEGVFFKRFRVIEVYTETITTVEQVAVFETEEN